MHGHCWHLTVEFRLDEDTLVLAGWEICCDCGARRRVDRDHNGPWLLPPATGKQDVDP